MEQILILALLALISFINWIFQRSAELRKQREIESRRAGKTGEHTYQQNAEDEAATPQPPAPPAADPNAEMRKLMEALRFPVEEETPPPRPEPPVLHEEPAPVLPEPEPVVVRPAPRARPASVAPTIADSTSVPLRRLRESLSSRDEIRRAILLREILGPPKADTLG